MSSNVVGAILVGAFCLIVLAMLALGIVVSVQQRVPKLRKAARDYRRLFTAFHRKWTLGILAVFGVTAGVSGTFYGSDDAIAFLIVGCFILWGRKVWITDDYDRAAKAAADAERERQEAERERARTNVAPPSQESLYSIFGLTTNATDADIRTAYRRLVRKYHPDRSNYSSAANAEQFRRIQAAYAELRAQRGSWTN